MKTPPKEKKIVGHYRKDKPGSIQSMFNHIAKSYDKTNAILSFQLHKWWNRQLVQRVTQKGHPSVLLDLCCGTGDIALSYLRNAKEKRTAYMLDFSSEMLAYAREKATRYGLPARHELHYLQADAHNIPLGNNSVDCATMAYGIRNVKNPEQCIADIFRVLKPGGTLGILELTEPTNKMLAIGHRFYLENCLPLIGKMLTSNQQAYQYLCSSIRSFIKPKELEAILTSTGFEDVASHRLNGGIATIVIGKKPNR